MIYIESDDLFRDLRANFPSDVEASAIVYDLALEGCDMGEWISESEGEWRNSASSAGISSQIVQNIFFAGGHWGRKVAGLGRVFPDARFMTLDYARRLHRRVLEELADRLEEHHGVMLTEFLKQLGTQNFDMVIISTGPTHGLSVLKGDYDRLLGTVKQGGILAFTGDTKLNVDWLESHGLNTILNDTMIHMLKRE